MQNRYSFFSIQGSFSAGIISLFFGAWMAIGLKFRGENIIYLPSPTYACESTNFTYIHPVPKDFGYV